MRIFTLCFMLFSMSLIKADEKYYYADHARSLRREAATEMCKRHKSLSVFGLGGGMIKRVNFVSVSFSSNRKLTEDEMRDLLVEGTLLLQNKINNAEKLRPYLSHYPFTPKGLEIAIFIHSNEKTPEELSNANAIDGDVRYRNGKRYPNNLILEESFEEALEKVDVEQIMQPKEKPSFLTRVKNLYRN